MRAWIGHECRLRDVRLASSKEAKPSITVREIEGAGMHCNRYGVPTSLARQREPYFNIASLYSIAKRNPTCEDAGKSRNRGSFFFESGIESSIESGYTQIPRAGSI